MSSSSLLFQTKWREEYRWHGDMLADWKRNMAYSDAIDEWVLKEAIECQNSNESTVCLEIGTGSGLLSLLLSCSIGRLWPSDLRALRPRLYACEVVEELHGVAARTFARAAKEHPDLPPVHLLPRVHSTDLSVGIPDGLPERAGLVLGELLDTGLLGEGLISSMQDATRRLARTGYASIPARAEVFAVLCQGPLAEGLGGLQAELPHGCRHGDDAFARLLGRHEFRPPRACLGCQGSAAAEGALAYFHFSFRFDMRKPIRHLS